MTYYTVQGPKLNIFLFYFFIWLCWDFVAAHGLSLVAASGGYPLIVVLRFLTVVVSLIAEHGV